MPLVTTKEILKKAQKEHYAVPAFNFENMEMAKGILEICEKENSPVILQTTSSTLKYINPFIAASIVKCYTKDINIPVALHLDHGNSFALSKECIENGYSSVMIDGSKLEFEENIKVSKEVSDYAKKFDIPVECELGKVGGKEDGLEVERADALFTPPEKAKEFVERTGCSSLAVAIGTSHGLYKEEPKLDFDRLKCINSLTDIPLVLHGTSGTKDEDVKKAISLGICKVNYATDLRVSYTKGVRECLVNKSVYDPKEYNNSGIKEMGKKVKHLIYVCGSNNKG